MNRVTRNITGMVNVLSLDIDVSALNGVGMTVADRLVTDVARRTLNRASVLAPVDVGRLRASGDMRVSRTSTEVIGEVEFDADYALAVHEGTGPHVIRPRAGQRLRFVVGGQVVYAKEVRHPGTRPRPFLYNALESVAGAEGFDVTRG